MRSFALVTSVCSTATNSKFAVAAALPHLGSLGFRCEGSMLLWVLMIAGWRRRPLSILGGLLTVLVTRVLVVLAAITAVFRAFTLTSSRSSV